MTADADGQTDLQYAGVGDRFLGWFIDNTFLAIVLLPGVALSGIVRTVYLLAWFLFVLFYTFALEGIWSNQTVGKYLLNMRVATEDGSPAGLEGAIVRNFVGTLGQVFGIFGLIAGAVFISRSDQNQRLGDRVASTVVIKTS